MLFEGLFAQVEEDARVAELMKHFKTAKKAGVKYCLKCGFCCNKRSCIPTPDELRQVAKYLDCTTTELIKKYYCVDARGITVFVKPAGVNQKDLVGQFIPWKRTFNEGKCIFLDKDNTCKIYEVRPKTARTMECWTERGEVWEDDYWDELMEAWKGKKILEVYPEFSDSSDRDEYED